MAESISGSAHLNCVGPKGAFYWLASYGKPVKSLNLGKELSQSSHLTTVPGGAFGLGGKNNLQLSYALSDARVIEGLRRLNSYFEKIGN